MAPREENYWLRRSKLLTSRRSLLRGAALGSVGIAGLSLVGCGDDDDDNNGGGQSEQPTSAPDVNAPKLGGTLKVGYGLEPSSLDPHDGTSGGDHYFFEDIYDFLVRHDETNTLRGDLSLAESWEIQGDTTIAFNLRRGVNFHDGTPFNSEAVKFNIERVQDPLTKSSAKPSFEVVESVETPDDYTAVFNLSKPSAGLLTLLGGRGGAINSPAAVAAAGDEYRSKPVSTGAMIFDKWVPGAEVSMKKNPEYWRKDANGIQIPYLDGISVKILPEPNAAFAALQVGDVHMNFIQATQLAEARGMSSFNIDERQGSGIAMILALNRQPNQPTSNIDFRRGLQYSVDPEAILQAVYQGNAILADGGMWPVGTWAYAPVSTRPTYDPQKARDFLAASGENVDSLNLDMISYESANKTLEQEMLVEFFADVGVKANPTTRVVGQFVKDFFEGSDYAVAPTGWSLYPEPSWISDTLFKPEALYNTGNAQTPEILDLIEQGNAEYDTEARAVIYQEISELTIAQMWHVPYIYAISYAGMSTKIKNQSAVWTGEAKWFYQNLWLDG